MQRGWVKHVGDRGLSSGKSGAGGAKNYKEVNDDNEQQVFGKSVEAWEQAMTPDEENAVFEYTGDGYSDWNYALRNETGNFETDIANLDSALNKFTLTQNIVTYRGMTSGAMEGLFGSKAPSVDEIYAMKGMIVSDKAFLSTSVSKSKAYGFSGSGDYILRINVPKGKNRGAYVRSHSQFNSEREFLMPRNAQLKITGASIDSAGRPIIHVDLV